MCPPRGARLTTPHTQGLSCVCNGVSLMSLYLRLVLLCVVLKEAQAVVHGVTGGWVGECCCVV